MSSGGRGAEQAELLALQSQLRRDSSSNDPLAIPAADGEEVLHASTRARTSPRTPIFEPLHFKLVYVAIDALRARSIWGSAKTSWGNVVLQFMESVAEGRNLDQESQVRVGALAKTLLGDEDTTAIARPHA